MTTITKTGLATLAALALSGAVLASADPAAANCRPRHVGATAALAGEPALGAAEASEPAVSFRPAEGARPACTTAFEEGRDAVGRRFKRRITVCG